MKLGYYDAKRMLYGLAGRTYYIDAPQSEAYYYDKMMSELELVKCRLSEEPDAEKQMHDSGYRAFTEELFPALARRLNLSSDWDYKDLYLAILETWAKELKLNKMHIYTTEEIVQAVRFNVRMLDSFPLI